MSCISNILLLIFTLLLFIIVSTTSHSIPCSESFLEINKKGIWNCNKLTTLGAEFGWEIDRNNERQIQIIFGARLEADMMWVAWGVNPGSSPQMVGTRAFIAVRQLNGSFVSNTYNITSETKLGCELQPSNIDMEVKKNVFEYIETIGYFTLQVTVILPPVYNISRLNHVWQVGYLADGMVPKIHPIDLDNVDARETIDLKSGATQHVGQHIHHLRSVHGMLNIVGWGIFLPTGAIIARYFKYPLELRLWWFSLHVSCQIVGYILGTIGFAIGLWLGNASKYYTFHTHRLFSIFIFTFTTLQMLALRLKPKKTDEYRNYWNMYHHFLGYALIAVIGTNIFQGTAIMKSERTWRLIYIAILGIFGIVVVVLELFTWTKFLIPSRRNNKKPINRTNSNSGGSSAGQVQPSSSPAGNQGITGSSSSSSSSKQAK